MGASPALPPSPPAPRPLQACPQVQPKQSTSVRHQQLLQLLGAEASAADMYGRALAAGAWVAPHLLVREPPTLPGQATLAV